MKTHQQLNWQPTIVPAILLSMLALFIPEILMGSTPASRAGQWLLELVFYASGALIIHEVVVRFQLNTLAVIFLGLAFGVIEEGILLQSVFNPGFLNLDLSYGRTLGVNWVWAQFIVVYHSVFSIAIPVLLAQMIFRKQDGRPWLSKIGLGVVAGLYIFSGYFYFFIFQNMSEFRAPVAGLIIVALLALIFIFVAFKMKGNLFAGALAKPIPFVFSGLISVLALCLWLLGLREVFTKGDGFPSWMIQAAGLLLIAILVLWFRLNRHRNWNTKNQLSVLSGALIASTIYGFYIIVGSKNKTDLIFQVMFALGVLVGMILLWRKIRID